MSKKKYNPNKKLKRPTSFGTPVECIKWIKRSVYLIARGRALDSTKPNEIKWFTLGTGFLVAPKDIESFILCGDFNLSHDTQSLKMIEEISAKNLIKEYGITSTRTSLYTKENKFADYMFIGSDILVKDFKVLPDEVSDHSPIYIELG